LAVLVVFCAGVVGAQELEKLKKPEPVVPEIFTLTGQYVRIAYNAEGFATLGYRIANGSEGEEWMLLEVGATLRKPAKNQTMKRDAFSLMLPDESTIGLATQEEFGKAGHLRALNERGNNANQACAIGFFADPTNQVRSLSYDQVELSWQRACLGRIFFKIPGKIQAGQYYLMVKFENSMLQIPFRIFTKAEDKEFKKKWKGLKKEHDAEYKK
jgi:hypothetical protein